MANAPSAAVQRLVDVVAQLRNPATGCPWDLEQTHASLVPYVLEEAHEVADAIRQGDDQHLKEELGDLLLQVVLHAQIAGEEHRFDLNAIADGISNKLIRRHPHVFGDAEAKTSDDVRRSWDAIKLEEQAEALAGSTSPLRDRLKTKVRGLPALAGAMTIALYTVATIYVHDTRGSTPHRYPTFWGVIQGCPAAMDVFCTSLHDPIIWIAGALEAAGRGAAEPPKYELQPPEELEHFIADWIRENKLSRPTESSAIVVISQIMAPTESRPL